MNKEQALIERLMKNIEAESDDDIDYDAMTQMSEFIASKKKPFAKDPENDFKLYTKVNYLMSLSSKKVMYDFSQGTIVGLVCKGDDYIEYGFIANTHKGNGHMMKLLKQLEESGATNLIFDCVTSPQLAHILERESYVGKINENYIKTIKTK